jgi:NAD(P)-dependent dehydrogenase (short-subunit alcohol dehydrogenase family)
MIKLEIALQLSQDGVSVFENWAPRLKSALVAQSGYLASRIKRNEQQVKICLEFQSQRLLSAWATCDIHNELLAEISPCIVARNSKKILSYTALITGASSGIGHALAERLLADERYTVVLLARRAKPLEALSRKYPGRVQVIVADLSDTQSLTNITKQLETRRLTHVIHNAGSESPVVPLCEVESEALLKQQALNLNAPLLLTNLIKSAGVDDCRVLFVSSGAAFVPWVGIGPYSVTKAALEMLCQVYQAERIHRNEQDMFFASVRPGGVHTELVERIKSTPKEIFPAVEPLLSRLATGDLLTPAQSADFIYWVLNIKEPSVYERHWNIKDREQLLKEFGNDTALNAI